MIPLLARETLITHLCLGTDDDIRLFHLSY
jgi:hypothetical protein